MSTAYPGDEPTPQPGEPTPAEPTPAQQTPGSQWSREHAAAAEAHETTYHAEQVPPSSSTAATPPPKLPVVLAVVAVVALLATIAIVGFLATRPTPGDSPVAMDDSGPPQLPASVGDLTRDDTLTASSASPAPGQPTPDGAGGTVTRNATYVQNDNRAYIAIAARPATDPEQLLRTQLGVAAVRPVNSAQCGRSETYDMCAVRRGQTVVIAVGLRGQAMEEIATTAQAIANHTR